MLRQIRSLVRDLGFRASDIMTPRVGLVTDEAEAILLGMDYVPAFKSQELLGIVDTRSEARYPASSMTFFRANDVLVDVVDELCGRYEKEEPTVVFVGTRNKTQGLISYADLNKPQVSVMLYAIISNFETQISSLIIGFGRGDWWTEKIGERNLERIRWKLAEERKNGVHLDLMHCANLSDKIRVVTSTEMLWRRLGYTSHKKAERELGSLEEWRNRVSHRSGDEDLLHSRRELGKLSRVLDRLERVLDALA